MSPRGGHNRDRESSARIEQIENRLSRLEDNRESSSSALESHKFIITKIFSALAIVVSLVVAGSSIGLSILTYSNRSDTRAAITDMQNAVQRSTDEMQRKFSELAGEAMKKPEVQILTSAGTPLDGQVFELSRSQNDTPKVGPIFLKNVGTRTTDALHVRLDCSFSVSIAALPGSERWLTAIPMEREFQSSYYLSVMDVVAGSTIAAKDNLGISAIPFTITYGVTNAQYCRLRVFYGPVDPAEAKFQFMWK